MADLNELVLAYATTVHKSQGSEYQAVIHLVTQHYIMLLREIALYGNHKSQKNSCPNRQQTSIEHLCS